MIKSGHRLDDIARYNTNQVKGFLGAISELEKEDIKEQAIAGRIAQAKDKDFKKFLKE